MKPVGEGGRPVGKTVVSRWMTDVGSVANVGPGAGNGGFTLLYMDKHRSAPIWHVPAAAPNDYARCVHRGWLSGRPGCLAGIIVVYLPFV